MVLLGILQVHGNLFRRMSGVVDLESVNGSVRSEYEMRSKWFQECLPDIRICCTKDITGVRLNGSFPHNYSGGLLFFMKRGLPE